MSEYVHPNIEGWMDDAELEWLYETAKGMESIVEVGSWKGRSTHALLSGCPGFVVAVDHFLGSIEERDHIHHEATYRDIGEIFWKNVGHFKNLWLLRMHSQDAVKYFAPKSIDMVFIDGGHGFEEVLLDLRLWRPIAKKILCGHDIGYNDIINALRRLEMNYQIAVSSIWRVDASSL